MDTISNQVVDLILTDVPYGQTQAEWDNLPNLNRLWYEFKRILKPTGTVIMTAIQPLTTDLINSNREWFRRTLVWAKTNATGALDAKRKELRIHEDILIFSPLKRMTYNPQMKAGKAYVAKRGKESELYGAQKSATTVNTGNRYPTTILDDGFAEDDVWVYENSNGAKIHPTQKPLKLFERLIKTYSNPGEVVCDPFVGSGTTAVAARNTDRIYLASELNPQYYKLACQRLSDDGFKTRIFEKYEQRSLFQK